MQKENLYYKNFTRDYAGTHLTKSKYNQYVCFHCSSGLGPHGTGGMTLYDNGYFCFSCRKSGDIFDLVGHFEGIEGYRNQLQRVNTNYQALSDADMINLNDGIYRNYITESTSWVFNERNSYIGDPSEDVSLYSPIVPGQPMYLMFGEFAWDTNNHWGWGDGYYTALFDEYNYWTDFATTGKQPDQKNYWSGYYRREAVESKAPAKITAKPTVTKHHAVF